MHGTPGVFFYRRCPECGTVFQDPRVDDEGLAGLYPPDYYTHAVRADGGGARLGAPSEPEGPRAGGGLRDAIRDGVRRLVAPQVAHASDVRPWIPLLARSRWIRERAFNDQVMDELLPWTTPPGRALDVGCGSGKLMGQLARVGWTVEGSEWDRAAANVASEATGMVVHGGGIEALGTSLGVYDLIVLSHVLEHLPDPRGSLGILARLLAPQGRLVVVYPNPESLLARWFGPDWFHWDPPRHLVLPPARALDHLARAAGLRVASVRTLARWAGSTGRKSRDTRAEVRPAGDEPSPGDRVLGWVERGAVALGATVGEEVVAVLRHRPTHVMAGGGSA